MTRGHLAARLFGVEQFGTADDVKSRLEAIERDPGRIGLVVDSRLHFDHAGGNELIPNACLVVQQRECSCGGACRRRRRLIY